MHTILAALAASAAVLTSAVFGSPLTAAGNVTATATVSFISWPKDVIYVYDKTAYLRKSDGSPVWPVHAAAERWDNDNPVDFRYTTTGCPINSQCVIVHQAEMAAPTAGLTITSFVGPDIKTSKVTLDTTFGRTESAARRRNVVCHELGHSLGLAHRTSTSSCLTSYVTSTRYPDATDIRHLNTMYGYR